MAKTNAKDDIGKCDAIAASDVRLFDLFKIGIGPSSSHTMGPMRAAGLFAQRLMDSGADVGRVQARAMGSLAWTGKGHQTDRALILGLAGFEPESIEPGLAEDCLAGLTRTGELALAGVAPIPFNVQRDIVLDRKSRAVFHPNSLRFEAWDRDGELIIAEDWISPGGGFVRCVSDRPDQGGVRPEILYVFATTAELLSLCATEGKTIAEIALANEIAGSTEADIVDRIDRILEVMFDTIARGLSTDGILPGGLNVRRRAKAIHDGLQSEGRANVQSPTRSLDYVAAYAMAVNEVNAAGAGLSPLPPTVRPG